MTTTLKPVRNLDVILASTAPWRSQILNRLNIPHRAVPHRYPEPGYESGSLQTFVQRLAQCKAESLQADYPEAMIIAADQLISVEETVLAKAGNRENAIRQLMTLNGRPHQLVCAVAVCFQNNCLVRWEEAKLQMRHLTRAEIEFYVDYDEPWDCAGSYKIESLGAALFSAIDVRDTHTIVGLPANLLLDLIRDWGYTNLA